MHSIRFALAILCLSRGAQAMRKRSKVNETEIAEDVSQGIGCSDYCILCNDGSTVWYGRSRSWFRSFVTLFTDGIIVPITLVGNMWMKSKKEKFSRWTGYLPTTGLFCEKVDIIKFPAGRPEPNAFTPLMLASRNWFGRISLNELKPYHPESNRPPKDWAQPQDYDAYVEGCKTLKSAGLKGKADQFASIFQNKCHSEVTQATFKCADHSRLCGAAGVKHLTEAKDRQQCMALKGDLNTFPRCERHGEGVAPKEMEPGI